MNKLFLTMLFAFSTILASAQFVGLTTLNEGTDSTWNVTDKIGIGYVVNEKLMDKLELGVGYSLHLWKGLCFCPNYTLSLKEDEAGEREGSLNLGVTYKF